MKTRKRSLDRRNKKMPRKLGAYAKTALIALGISGGIAAVIILPGLALVIKEFTKHRNRPYRRKSMYYAMQRMQKTGYIRIVERNDELCACLTRKGRKLFEQLQKPPLAIPKQTLWDHQWRIVAFDIPEKLGKARSALRQKLIELGFHKIQKSIYAHPYPCEVEIAYVSKLFGVEPYIQLITATSFNGEEKIKKSFNLT
ncbi:MAG: CRISPR-associated endonuclease Cas2 [bacterium]|nr:CRISPR-associated endonuclease Cas2 [bacterium]